MRRTLFIAGMLSVLLVFVICACSHRTQRSRGGTDSSLQNYIVICTTATIDEAVANALSTTYACPAISEDEARLWCDIVAYHYDISAILTATTNDMMFAVSNILQRRAGVLFLVQENRADAAQSFFNAWRNDTNDTAALFMSALLLLKTADSNAFFGALHYLQDIFSAREHVHLLRGMYANGAENYSKTMEECRQISDNAVLRPARDYCELEARYFSRCPTAELSKAVEKMLAHDSGGADINAKIACAALRAGNHSAARAAALRAIVFGTTNCLMYQIAAALDRFGCEETCGVEIFIRQHLAVMQPTNSNHRMALVRCLAERGYRSAARNAAWQLYLVNSNEARHVIHECLL